MRISDKVSAQIDEISTALCLAIQLEDPGQASVQFERLERLVLESMPRENPDLLQAAAMNVLRRAQRLATTNRQAVVTEIATLGAADPYQPEGRRFASWRLDG